MSRYILGNTECPPQGDISSPNDMGRVSQFCGRRWVSAGSRKEPGASGFMKPSMKMIRTTKSC